MTISNDDNVIDSRDVIARIEELQGERTGLVYTVNEAMRAYEANKTSELAEAHAVAARALMDWDASGDGEELKALEELAEDASGSPDWLHGETLIRESYFAEYIEELIDDCYRLPKEMKSGEWPWRHITIDFEAAADEVKADYIEADFDGVAYLIRA